MFYNFYKSMETLTCTTLFTDCIITVVLQFMNHKAVTVVFYTTLLTTLNRLHIPYTTKRIYCVRVLRNY